MATCSITLQKDNLGTLIDKTEFFLFRAAEQKGIDFNKLAREGGKVSFMLDLLDTVRDVTIPSYINDYKEQAKLNKEAGDLESADDYEKAIVNLQNMLVVWKQFVPNFIQYSSLFNVKTKFKLNEEGLVDLNDVADDEEKMLKKMVFDQPANEIDPTDEIDKSVELFIRSIPVESFDEYGFTSGVDYGSFVRNMFADLENSISMDELLTKLKENEEKVPEYKYIIDKLTYKPGLTRQESRFRIAFRNSFVKAFIPIYQTSIEDGKTIKIFEAAGGKKSLYEKIIASNFALRGMPVATKWNKVVENGVERMVPDDSSKINLAVKVNGVWQLNKDSIQDIKEYLKSGDNLELRQIEFIKGLGLKLSQQTQAFLLKTDAVGEGKKKSGNYAQIPYISNHLIKALENLEDDGKITNPFKVIKSKIKSFNPKTKETTTIADQATSIGGIIDAELKRSREYNTERSMVNSNGDRVHAIQLHNNITIVNKYLSDPKAFPTLQDIIANEPSLFWLDPRRNPAIRNDLFLNSLFFLDEENFGKRRRITKDGSYSTTEGEFASISVVNTGGVQLKLISEFTRDGASSTGLNELDKLLQDINLFKKDKSKKLRLNSMLRLSDKSTDLGMGMNYYYDPITKKAVRSPLGDETPSTKVFNTAAFVNTLKAALQDVFEMKYLRSKGFLKDMTRSSTNLETTWGYFDGILLKDTKDLLNGLVENIPDINDTKIYLDQFSEEIEKDIQTYFKEYAESFYNKFSELRKFGIYDYGLVNASGFKDIVYDYLANAFIIDMSQMKLFFGDATYFKDFHKRASKDSATGIISFMDKELISELNDFGNTQGWGSNTNLSGRRFIERIYQSKLTELENSQLSEEQKESKRKKYKNERDIAFLRQNVQKSFRSAVLNDVEFKSEQSKIIKENIEYLRKKGFISDQMYKIYTAEKGLSKVITEKYEGKEGDGQGYCTFDFYRIMSIATGKWDDDQERVYKKIVEYNHYDELAEEETDPTKKAEYLQKRDAVGYDPTEAVYFPPKKFQYSGPQNYERTIGDTSYATNVPVFDKFSLQPLIPTVIKKGNVKTAHWYLARKMEYNGVGYVKFESASKVETPKKMDDLYTGFDKNKPSERVINDFSTGDKFNSEQELYFNHLREQVAIDADIHESSIFGSQIRKIVVMNLTTRDKDGKILFPEFRTLYNNYKGFLEDLVTLEKTSLYNDLGIERKNGRLHVKDLSKLVDYFFNEIAKKDQNTNVRKALKYDEKTGKFEIPLDAAVQAQVIEGIIISAINNRIVRYKTNGSMLIQTAITGSEAVKFDKDASAKALETYGNKELKYYEVEEGTDGKPTVTKMDVKISLTGQWLKLLELPHPDGGKVGSLARLNDLLKNNPEWVSKNEKAITMISYRIPTAGRNFLDVMKIKEFLPASAGDVIIMPTEAIIKSGSDFDIDKMFTFYPNLNKNGTYAEGSYTPEDLNNPDKYNYLKGVIQNKVYETMGKIILHPANYLELVTPSENYHIMPIINEIYKKLNPDQKEREKTDYKNTDILNREKNIKKFLSLLKGKSDLGIAAIANTFNVLFQLSNAKASADFLNANDLKTFFNVDSINKTSQNNLVGIDYSGVFDEDGMLKSEFFTEFITAFVDVAKDDYVFAVNVVTELSPIMFYMKYMGLSTGKILNFVNQPAIRFFTKRLMTYQNMFVKANGVALNESARSKAIADTLAELGYSNEENKTSRYRIGKYLENSNYNASNDFTEEGLGSSIKPDGDLSKLSTKEKLSQIAMILELENLKVQSNSMTEAQTALNFDTKPFASSFDVNARNKTYEDGLNGSNILSPNSLKNIKENSVISHLDVSDDIRDILAELFPVRNNKEFNNYLLTEFKQLKANSRGKNKAIRTQDDMLKFARVAKNDYIGYILQNFIGKSKEGVEFFKTTFETDKEFNEYMKELVETSDLNDTFSKIQELPEYDLLADTYPFIRNITVEPGESNNSITTFNIVPAGSTLDDKEKIISGFEKLINSDASTPEKKMIRDFFRNLALYSTFQSGLNTSSNSYTDLTPLPLVNRLYGYAVEEYNKLTPADQQKEYPKFYALFVDNNPGFFDKKSNVTPIQDVSTRGKWYTKSVKLSFKPKFTGKMTMKYGEGKRADVKAESTFDAILSGERTATTRYDKLSYWKQLKVGDIITWDSGDGRKVDVEVTKALAPLKGSGKTPEQWSKLEGWSREYFEKKVRPKLDKAWQIEYRLVPAQPSTVVKTSTQPTQEPSATSEVKEKKSTLEVGESEYKTGKIYNKDGKEIFAGVVDGKIYINKDLLDKYSNEEVLKNQSEILNTILKNLDVYEKIVDLPREKFIRFLVEHEKAHLEFEKEGKTFRTDEIEEAYVNARALVKIGILKLKEFDLSGTNEAVQRLQKYFPTREQYINDAVELTAKKMDNVRVSLSTMTGYKMNEFTGSLWGKKLKVSSMDDFYFLQGKDGFPKNKEELRERISEDLARNFPNSLAREYWKKILKSLPDDEKALLSNWAYYTNFKSYTTQYGKPYFDFNKEPYPELNKGDREKYTEWDSFITGVLESFTGSGRDLWFANNLISDSKDSVIDWYKNLTPEKFDKHIENLSRAMAFKSMVVASFERGSVISATDTKAKNIENLKKAYFDIKQRTELVSETNKNIRLISDKVENTEIIDKIEEWIKKEVPGGVVKIFSEDLAAMYEKEKLSGETIEEFLNRLSCKGLLI